MYYKNLYLDHETVIVGPSHQSEFHARTARNDMGYTAAEWAKRRGNVWLGVLAVPSPQPEVATLIPA